MATRDDQRIRPTAATCSPGEAFELSSRWDKMISIFESELAAVLSAALYPLPPWVVFVETVGELDERGERVADERGDLTAHALGYGGGVRVRTIDDGSTWHTLDRFKVRGALLVALEFRPHLVGRIFARRADGVDASIFVQLAIFGRVVFE